MIRHAHDGPFHSLLKLAVLQRFSWRRLDRLHQIDVFATVVLTGTNARLKRIGRMTGLGLDQVPGFIGGLIVKSQGPWNRRCGSNWSAERWT